MATAKDFTAPIVTQKIESTKIKTISSVDLTCDELAKSGLSMNTNWLHSGMRQLNFISKNMDIGFFHEKGVSVGYVYM